MTTEGTQPTSRRARNRRVSIRDVAQASGVSLTTVSLILNNDDARISQATRAKVRSIIDQLGYRPNRLAQGLQKRRSQVLAILVPHLRHTFADPYFGELISGIYDRASRAGYKILLEAASQAFIRHKRHIDLFDRCFVDGMLFMGASDHHSFVCQFRGSQRPFVLVNSIRPDLSYVVGDYPDAGRLAADHLAGLGHRHIAMIHGAVDVETARRLRDSFTRRLAEHGITLEPSHFADGFYTEEGGGAAAEQLVRNRPEVTAIFTGNDKMAAGAIQQLRMMGRRVPHDISVMGCDDIHQAAFVTPSLTTIRTPLYDLGKLACQRVIDVLRGDTRAFQEVLPVDLIVRQSTGRPSDDY